MAAILCLDFDDTVVLENLTRGLLERFADPGWRAFEQAYKDGRMSVEEYNIAALDLVPIDVGPEEMAAFARETGHPRAGLLELVDWAHWNDWLVAVVSNGFDLTVDPVLDDLGLDRIARHRGRTARPYRWRARYVSPRGIEVHVGELHAQAPGEFPRELAAHAARGTARGILLHDDGVAVVHGHAQRAGGREFLGELGGDGGLRGRGHGAGGEREARGEDEEGSDHGQGFETYGLPWM